MQQLLTCEYLLDGHRPVSVRGILSPLETEPEPSALLLQGDRDGLTPRHVDKLQIWKKMVRHLNVLRGRRNQPAMRDLLSRGLSRILGGLDELM